ncbi:hypothetical protein ACUIJQ_01330 [Levilactobacillus hammesii]|uniref:Uncharacterized protein n=1 Tax=Levilactobacillus hammesii DSM 16381 TaxID=1423753 RepID=A0A0R1USM6_9LACO|nr:hypothetical protein [Levilactobacillus hammesii]KRL96175.1 hypothetical protein FD28_GL001926 [Levilactobacillus hammesii DSM 16381]
MKKIFGYVLGLVAALFAAGAIATTANADGSNADAASGSSNAASGAIAPAMGASDAGGAAAISAADSSSIAQPAKKPAKKLAKKPAKKRVMKKVAKKRIKKAKKLAAAKKMRGRYHYRKDSREIFFQKGKKGDEVELFNREGKEVKKFKVRKNGRFEIKLTKKQAEKLDKGGKYFRFDVQQKGYKAYEIRYHIYK